MCNVLMVLRECDFVSVVPIYVKFAISVSSLYCYFPVFIFTLFFASLTSF